MAIFADHLLVPSRTDCFTAVMWPVCASSSTPKTDLNSDETFFHMSCANGLDLVLPVLHSILIAISPPVLFLPSFPRDTRFFNPSLPLFLPLSFSPSLSLSIFLFSPSVFFKRFSSSVTCNEQLHRRIVHRVKGKWANFFPRLISLFSPSLFWIFLLNFISSCFFFDDGLWEFISFSATENSFIFFSSYCFFFLFSLHYLLNIARYTWRFPFHTMISQILFSYVYDSFESDRIYKSTMPIQLHERIFFVEMEYFRWALRSTCNQRHRSIR